MREPACRQARTARHAVCVHVPRRGTEGWSRCAERREVWREATFRRAPKSRGAGVIDSPRGAGRHCPAPRVSSARRFPIGAEVQETGGAHFRVWAPKCRTVDVVLEGDGGEERDAIALGAEADGYFSGVAAAATAGTLYRFRLDGSSERFPDPASRFQPRGPH
ncbi:MAG TPA: hypothetical protein VJ596_07315, partial [Gemmatimonadaceae bacterium]|nr:hypothetical protein [Gemmatimonadaceae bacterium]